MQQQSLAVVCAFLWNSLDSFYMPDCAKPLHLLGALIILKDRPWEDVQGWEPALLRKASIPLSLDMIGHLVADNKCYSTIPSSFNIAGTVSERWLVLKDNVDCDIETMEAIMWIEWVDYNAPILINKIQRHLSPRLNSIP